MLSRSTDSSPFFACGNTKRKESVSFCKKKIISQTLQHVTLEQRPKLKKPPGHKPSLPLSKSRMRSPRPPYSHAPFLPPPTTPCPTWVMLMSKVTPLAANLLRSPPQSPVRVERLQISPE